VFILQRGAADGLHTVVPYADPAYARWRGALALDTSSVLKLDGTFALHPALTQVRQLFGAGQASFFHAVASPYRDRSHFDGQNVLETGGNAPYQLRDGWMNRLMDLLPPTGKQPIAFAPAVPMVLRGTHEVTSYAPSALPQASDDLMLRVAQLYANDSQLHGLWSSALEARGMAAGMAGGQGEPNNRQDPAALGRLVAGFLARVDGPRIAFIETSGWDTHSAQRQRLDAQLRGLDGLIGGLQQGLGAAWSETAVLVATEFGRTVAVNGTGGTDHGTGAVSMLLGGRVQGGRVVADWPGLATTSLLDGRDLRPTLALNTVIAQTCAELFGLEPERVARVLFPEIPRGAPMAQLLRS
jgi:uncharacterized protein (DUF1501 family)